MPKKKSLEGSSIGFRDEIKHIPMGKIKPNPLNPRQRFVEKEFDELLESIDSKGILTPLIVYKENGLFRLVDGERRLDSAKRLKLKEVPVHVLERKPTEIENLSMMFHIHNVREAWTEISITLSIQRVINEIGTKDVKQISKITSLSEYKIRKYLKILDYPKSTIDKFLESEKKEYSELDVDILAELHTPLKQLKNEMPDILQQYSKEKIVDICLKKKKGGQIKKNKEFRAISKIIKAAKEKRIDKNVAKEKLLQFLEKPEVTLKEIYHQTAETTEQSKNIQKECDNLIEDVKTIDTRKLTAKERDLLFDKLKKLMKAIKGKVRG